MLYETNKIVSNCVFTQYCCVCDDNQSIDYKLNATKKNYNTNIESVTNIIFK